MADDLAARLGQKFFVEIDGKRFVDDAPQVAADRITALQDQNRKLVEALRLADARIAEHGDMPHHPVRAAIAEAEKGEG